jgi:hypothetical protein
MLRKILLLFISISPLLTLADAAPKLSEQVIIKFVDDKGETPLVDSICVIVPGWETQIATLHYDTEQFWTGATLQKEADHYLLFTHDHITQFSVVVFVDSQKYTSALLPAYSGNELFILKIKDGKLADISPFFHCSWASYLASLFLTLLLEVLIGLIFFYKNQGDKTTQTYVLSFVLVNVITHFSLWYVYSNTFIPLFFLELLVVIAEFVYWKLYLKIPGSKAFLISLLTNFVSWISGGLVSLLA